MPRPTFAPPAPPAPPAPSAILADGIRRLAARRAALSRQEILDFCQTLRLAPDELAPYRRFDPAGYRRNRIYADDRFELLLLCWLPGQQSRIHNHHGSRCGVLVVEGVASETAFETTPGGAAKAGAAHQMAAGSLLVNEHQDIHQIRNAHDRNLVTLHLYSPPLRQMEIFSPADFARRIWEPEYQI
nr:cysteine dioxygenase family protein [Chromobacterium sp. ASV5]